MGGPTDWFDWHAPYADPVSPLSRRLRTIQGHLVAWLDARPEPSLRLVSVCAGQGHDIIEVLGGRADAARVEAHLIEADPRNVAAARAGVAAAGLVTVAVHEADAGDYATYAGLPRADLLLLAGVLGNLTIEDARATVAALPSLCAAGATVIWTRARRPVDVIPELKKCFVAAGFVELAFDAPDDVHFSVGVHQLVGVPAPRPDTGRLFHFATT